MTGSGPGDNTKVYEVPPDHYFMMGDNRDNSQDSRFLDGPVGFVPAENLIGRAEIIFFSVNGAPGLGILEVAVVGPADPHLRASMKSSDRARLEEKLGHRFANPNLLDRALTHASAVGGSFAQGAGALISAWSSWATVCSASSSPTR